MRYAELHCKTNFSFLKGASHPDELVRQAAALGYRALAVTDRNSLAGVVRAHVAAKELDLQLIIGAEITPIDAPPVVLWPTDRASYARLSRLLTRGRRAAPKGECLLTLDDIAEFAQGLIAGVTSGEPASAGGAVKKTPPKQESQTSASKLRIANYKSDPHNPQSEIRNPKFPDSPPSALPPLHSYRDIFPGRCYLLAELHYGPDDPSRLAQLQQLARQTRIPLVAAGDVHYHIPARMPLHDVLTAIRHRTTVAALEGTHLFPNAARHLRPLDEIRTLFAAAPDTVAHTMEIADRCRFSLEELKYEYPTELVEQGVGAGDWGLGKVEGRGSRVESQKVAGLFQQSAIRNPKSEIPQPPALSPHSPLEFLTQLTWQGAAWRYPSGLPEKIRSQLEYELTLIGDLHYESYFLTVWDLVRFARSKNILCQGRGSAANSAVCFCLGVTSVDPATSDLLFERFISRERAEAPDIDIDFEHQRREEVLQYLYNKYGRERAGLAATVITYCSRSAIRDVGKALGLSLDRVDALAKHVEGYTHEPKLAGRCRDVGVDPRSKLGKRLIYCVNEIIGFPRHLSQHVGGMVMTQGPLCEIVPIENAAMEDRTVIQWDKDDLDELGILKVDCLCLGMLTAIHKCFDLLRENGVRNRFCENALETVPDPFFGRELTLATIPKEDPAVYDMICRADTIGVFQIESRAQMSMLPRLRPRCFYDLVIEVAIVRPGPIQGNMVHPYLRRRAGEEPETYPNDAIRDVLHKTLGVPIFQEQAMRLAVVAAGFTPGEADQLRRAMAAWRRPGLIDQFRQKLLAGMRANHLPEEFAQRVYQQIEGFGEYGFPESHAASFALLVYASAWLKHYYPAAFAAALINSQPMGFYQPAQLVQDARDHGVPVRPIDVNHSHWDCTLEAGTGDGEVASATVQSNFGLRIADCGLKNPNLQSEIRNPKSPFLRLGLRMLNGLGERAAHAIEQARAAGSFTSIDDFARRTGLGQATIKRLAQADAFGSIAADRRQSLWQALAQEKKQRDMPLFTTPHIAEPSRFDCKAPHSPEPSMLECTNAQNKNPSQMAHAELDLAQDGRAMLPPMQPYEQVIADYRTTGLSLRAHPISFYRKQLNRLGITPAVRLIDMPDQSPVRVAGLVLLRQRPGTAKGITFVTLEDETGTMNLVVHQHTWDRYYRIARRAAAWIAHGHIQKALQSQVPIIHVVVKRLESLAEPLSRLQAKSRDFR